MKIKTKLTLGVGLLFLLVLLLGIVGTLYITDIKRDTNSMLVANYSSLEYGNSMLVQIEQGTNADMSLFAINLLRQKRNITEPGEAQVTRNIETKFEQLRSNPSDNALRSAIRLDLNRLMDINMRAIKRKSQEASSSAERATFWMISTAALCLVISLVLLINLPRNIGNAIQHLIDSTKQISARNYSERVHLAGHSEFAMLAESFNEMASKLQEFNKSNVAELMLEKQRIETLINKMSDPVFGLDQHLRLIFVNSQAVSISGLLREEIVGCYAKDLAVRNDLIRSLVDELLFDMPSERQSKKIIKIFSEGKENYYEREILHISLTPDGESLARVVGHTILLRNVTSYKELDFAKTNFIATVSHEFKTPIAAIKMSAQLLGNSQVGNLNQQQHSLVMSITDDANRLLKITGELLDMAQVESGNIHLNIAPSDPLTIVSYAVNATQTQAAQKQIKLEVTTPEVLKQVMADSEKTAWVLTNLISNAIRFSYDNSTVHITIEENGQNIVFLVRDTGQGIAPEYRDKIFNRYFRVPGSVKEGTGLGLAISKEFIEAQGGTITVSSEYGQGSVFAVSLSKVTA
jgi:two-component system, NtrC family, sensor histidine kinase KinB